MKTSAKQPKIPTLRSLEDLKQSPDLEKVFNLSVLYALTIDTSLQETLDRQGCFHPSACGMCRRAQVFHFIRTPPTDRQSKRVKEIFKLGHVIHDVVQSALERVPQHVDQLGLQAEFQREVPCNRETDALYLDYQIAGTCDGILRLWNDTFEQRGTVEIKSSGDEKFKEVKEQAVGFKNHLMQAHLYAFRFDTPIIWMFYYSKNNSLRDVKSMFFDHQIFDEAVTFFYELQGFLARGQIPPRDESYLECGDCVYRSLCDPIVLKSKHSTPILPKTLIRRKRA
jgi:CRISPR/Cas system-associated exonuclease Cas4 (RecB family)